RDPTRALSNTGDRREQCSLRPTEEWCLHYRSGNVLAADADGEGRSNLRKRCRDVREGDVLFDARPVRTARHLANHLAVMRDLVAVPRSAALDHGPGGLAARPGGLFRRHAVAAGEFL